MNIDYKNRLDMLSSKMQMLRKNLKTAEKAYWKLLNSCDHKYDDGKSAHVQNCSISLCDVCKETLPRKTMSYIDKLHRDDRSTDAHLVERYEELLGNADRNEVEETEYRELTAEMARIFPSKPKKKQRRQK
jgi:hypothetical protein